MQEHYTVTEWKNNSMPAFFTFYPIDFTLTGIGHAKPWRLGHDLPPGISSSLVAIFLWVVGQHICQREDITHEPHQHDSHDDLPEQSTAEILRILISC